MRNSIIISLLLLFLVLTIPTGAKVLPSLLTPQGETSRYAISLLNTFEVEIIPLFRNSYSGSATVHADFNTCEVCIESYSGWVSYTGSPTIHCFRCFKEKWYDTVKDLGSQ